jgi:hypothetical protein
MRANITYSVDVDMIPEEISRVARSEQMCLNTLFEVVQAEIKRKNLLGAREAMTRLRNALGHTDIRLFEADKILAGYVDMLNQDEEEPGEEGDEQLSEEGEASESG